MIKKSIIIIVSIAFMLSLTACKTFKIFSKDADFPILQGLEKEDGTKSDIFYYRTVNALTEINVADSVEEALQISMDKCGKVDIPYMAKLLELNYDSSVKDVCAKVCKELLEKELCFRDPEKQLPDSPYSGIVDKSEYLSGHVRKKLKVAEVTMLGFNPHIPETDYRCNVKALEKVIPEDIRAENIAVRMGVPWIETDDYTSFLEDLSGNNSNSSRKREVHYSPVTGVFEISGARAGKSELTLNESTVYGTSDFNMYQLSEKILIRGRLSLNMKPLTRTTLQKLSQEPTTKQLNWLSKKQRKSKRNLTSGFSPIRSVPQNMNANIMTFSIVLSGGNMTAHI